MESTAFEKAIAGASKQVNTKKILLFIDGCYV
jgi:hypothetical protein